MYVVRFSVPLIWYPLEHKTKERELASVPTCLWIFLPYKCVCVSLTVSIPKSFGKFQNQMIGIPPYASLSDSYSFRLTTGNPPCFN